MRRRARRKADRLAIESIDLALAAPQVVAHRVARMLAAGHAPTVADQQEFLRMGAEKMEAFVEIWMAMATQAIDAQQRLLLSMMRAWSMPWVDSSFAAPWLSRRSATRWLEHVGLALLAAAVTPVRKRAVANAKRLQRRKR